MGHFYPLSRRSAVAQGTRDSQGQREDSALPRGNYAQLLGNRVARTVKRVLPPTLAHHPLRSLQVVDVYPLSTVLIGVKLLLCNSFFVDSALSFHCPPAVLATRTHLRQSWSGLCGCGSGSWRDGT